jgi:hypothetical protein
MPAVAPYIPPRQSNFDAWFNNFSTLITASPSTYGLTPADATTIAGYYSTWHTDYLLVTSPTTKTAQAVAAKNQVYAQVLPPVRSYAQQVANNPGVSSAAKIALGLNPKTSTPSPVSAPASNPVLTLQSQSPGAAILRYRDSAASVSVKSKPYGVKGLVLFGYPGSANIVSSTFFTLGQFTKSPFVLNTAALPAISTTPGSFAPVGSAYSLSAAWATQKGLKSPSAPILIITLT